MRILKRLSVEANEERELLAKGSTSSPCYYLGKDEDGFYTEDDEDTISSDKNLEVALRDLADWIVEVWDSFDARSALMWSVSEVTKKQKKYGPYSHLEFIGANGKKLRNFLKENFFGFSIFKENYEQLEALSKAGFTYEQSMKIFDALLKWL